MTIQRLSRGLLICTAVLLGCSRSDQQATDQRKPSDKTEAAILRVLMVDGQNNHDWVRTTPYMRKTLESCGRFITGVATSPPEGGNWEQFNPDFSKFDVVVSNYNGELWPSSVQANLERFIEGGGGLVIIHGANNPFAQWPAFNRMIGLAWRGDTSFGDRIYLDEEGNVVRVPKGEGISVGHGARHEFMVTMRDLEHPITRGMPRMWLHAKDELYHGQRGPARDMQILATAYSDPQSGGSGRHEPMVWVIPYGEGRVFVNLMGHVWGDDAEMPGIRGIGFQALLRRGVEWAATGDSDIPIPENFPTQYAVTLAPLD